MSQPPTVFLERQSYRRRRMMDAARLLPLLGAALLALPLLWPDTDQAAVASGAVEPVRMSEAIFYVFGVWAGLIVLAAFFALAARGWRDSADARGPR